MILCPNFDSVDKVDRRPDIAEGLINREHRGVRGRRCVRPGDDRAAATVGV